MPLLEYNAFSLPGFPECLNLKRSEFFHFSLKVLINKVKKPVMILITLGYIEIAILIYEFISHLLRPKISTILLKWKKVIYCSQIKIGSAGMYCYFQ